MGETAKVMIEVPGGSSTLIAEARQFKTGSRGFYAQGKVQAADGRRFQVTTSIVEIGSKHKSVP